jgi:MHS family proline/betaine transporter-like MFS transporter
MNTLYLLLFSILVLCFGYLADYIPRKFLLVTVCCAMFIFSYPLFLLLASGEIEKIHLALGIFTLIFSMFIPSAFVSMIELFVVQERFTSLSFSFNVGLAVFGGTCPLIATWLIEITHNMISPAYYLMLAALLGLVTSMRLPTHCEQSNV